MVWTPIKLPTGPVAASESDVDGDCSWCDAPDGQPCATTDCGTYDYDDTVATQHVGVTDSTEDDGVRYVDFTEAPQDGYDIAW